MTDELSPKITVSMSEDTYREVQRQVAQENYRRGTRAGEEELLNVLGLILTGQIKMNETSPDLSPKGKTIWNQLVSVIQMKQSLEQNFEKQVREDAFKSIEKSHIDTLDLKCLDEYLSTSKPDTLEEAILYDYAFKRRKDLYEADRQPHSVNDVRKAIQVHKDRVPDDGRGQEGPLHAGKPSGRGSEPGRVLRGGFEAGGRDQRENPPHRESDDRAPRSSDRRGVHGAQAAQTEDRAFADRALSCDFCRSNGKIETKLRDLCQYCYRDYEAKLEGAGILENATCSCVVMGYPPGKHIEGCVYT